MSERGWVRVSEFVTDGIDTWLESMRFLYYSQREAERLFKDHVRANGWKIVAP